VIHAFVPDDVNALGYMLLLFVGVVLPALIFRSARKLGSRPLPISRSRFFRQTIIFQLVLALMCAWGAWTNGILIMPLPDRPLISFGAAVILYLVMLTALKLRWKSRSSAAKQRLYDILPRTSAEFGEYALVCIVAGVAEEFIYRGVLTGLLQRITGITLVTVITLSVSFAVAHSMQGLRSVAGIFVIALACHALVWFAQSLIPMMAVHFAYDLTAGMLIPRWVEAEGVAT
jgi:membrane protease YdiL (CAAX protease family)